MRDCVGVVLYRAAVASAGLSPAFAQTKSPITPPITLDEFMNATELKQARLSADGTAAVLATNVPDYRHNRFADG